MSRLKLDDDELHYPSTPAHCWIAPIGEDQREWEEKIRRHLVEHLLTGQRWQHAMAHLELS